MSSKNILVILIAVFVAVVTFSCEEDIFTTENLTDSFLTPHDTSTTDFQIISYQVPPQLGGMNRLNVGSIGQFEIPFILLKPGNLDFLNDSLVTVDSAYFRITFDSLAKDSIDVNSFFELGFIEVDSGYSENSTNHTNIDWIPAEYPKLPEVSITEDTLFNQFLKFDIDTSRIIAWADTSNPDSLFILKLVEEFPTELITFYSRESSNQSPFIEVFYHIDPDTSKDTSKTILMMSDISLIIPPELNVENFDSTRAYVSVGAGFRSLVSINFDSLKIPRDAVVIKAHIEFTPDSAESNFLTENDFEIQLFALTDSTDVNWGNIFDIFDEDNIFHGASSDMRSNVSSLDDSIFKINVKNIIQALIVDRFENLGFKLLATNSGSVYDYLSFFTQQSDYPPRLEVLYEVP
ncbi:MAG: hypothetical protein IIB44_00370 [Candidatus Marinimicrobia bacterium]|nr:hypothetical protein [Candidatus Neomarinimicrobiota bacterium]